jgi:hypothetical protein
LQDIYNEQYKMPNPMDRDQNFPERIEEDLENE